VVVITSEERPLPAEYAPFYSGYISRVPPGPILSHLRSQHHETIGLLSSLPDAKANFAYAPGKWTIKQVVGHLSDVERVMVYRALRFARNDRTALPGFDENLYGTEGGFTLRSLKSLLEELERTREATVAFFSNLPPEHFLRAGEANGKQVSVRALAYFIAGHELHHRAILKERYL
jgi:uncharacterized damage-inducible protein DinB